MSSFINGNHVYRNVWLSVSDDELYGEMDPRNAVDGYAETVKKNNRLVVYYCVGKKSLRKLSSTSFELTLMENAK